MGNINPICQEVYLQSQQSQIQPLNDNEQVLDQKIQPYQHHLQQDVCQEHVQYRQTTKIQKINNQLNDQQFNQDNSKNIKSKQAQHKNNFLNQKNHILKLSRKTLQTNKNSSNKYKSAKAQKNSSQREFTYKQKEINNRIHQSHQFFKELKIVKLYQKKYDDLFLFNSSDNQKNMKNIQFKDKEHLQYHNFLIGTLQILQRLHRTGKHKNILKLIYDLDKEYMVNPSIKALEKIQKLKQSIVLANLQFLDMLYYKLASQQLNDPPIKMVIKQKSLESVKNFNEQKIIDVKKIIMSKKEELQQKSYYQNCKNIGFEIYKKNKVCFYILAGGADDIFWKNSSFNSSELKLSENKVSLVKELVQLNLSNSSNILEILLSRYDAFASLLQVASLSVIIFTNNQKFQQIQQYIVQNRSTYKKLLISVLCQTEQAVLDKQGNLVLNDQKDILFYPNGTGDLWDHMIQQQQDCGSLKQLKSKGFQFIQIVGTNNCLQHCFDCFMMGLCQNKQLKWGTKVIENQRKLKKSYQTKKCSKNSSLKSSQIMKNSSLGETQIIKNFHKQNQFNGFKINKLNQNTLEEFTQKTKTITLIQKICPIKNKFLQIEYEQVLSKIFLNKDQKISKTDPNQLNQYKLDNCDLIFTNHSIISVSFLQQVLKSQRWKQERLYKKKLVYHNEKYPQLICFETDYTDIFNFTQNLDQQSQSVDKSFKNQNLEQPSHKYLLFKYERQNQFHPFQFYEKGMFDIQSCSKAISNLHLSYLDLEKFFGQKCYIDPHVSLQGQNLSDLKQELKNRLKQNNEATIFPLYIFENV